MDSNTRSIHSGTSSLVQNTTTEIYTKVEDKYDTEIEEDGILAEDVEISHFCEEKEKCVDIPDSPVPVPILTPNGKQKPVEIQDYESEEIFVRHTYEEDERGDPLGGFLCTRVRKDNIFLHTFSKLEKYGILAKDLKLKEKDILVGLNKIQILGSSEFNHCKVLEMFKTLPMEATISMEVYSPSSQLFTTIEFILKGFREVMVKEEDVKLMVEPATVIALEFPREAKFLTNDNGQLSYKAVPNHKTDCSCHFVFRKYYDDKMWCMVYSFQVQLNPSLYLCYNGTTLDFLDECNGQHIPKFRKLDKYQEAFLSPFGTKGKYIYYNKCEGMFMLASPSIAFNEEGYGLVIRKTNCKP